MGGVWVRGGVKVVQERAWWQRGGPLQRLRTGRAALRSTHLSLQANKTSVPGCNILTNAGLLAAHDQVGVMPARGEQRGVSHASGRRFPVAPALSTAAMRAALLGAETLAAQNHCSYLAIVLAASWRGCPLACYRRACLRRLSVRKGRGRGTCKAPRSQELSLILSQVQRRWLSSRLAHYWSGWASQGKLPLAPKRPPGLSRHQA